MMGDSELIRQLLAILAVFGLLGAAVWALGRRRKLPLFSAVLARHTGTMTVIDRVRLTPQHTVALIKVGRRAVLIAADPGGSHLLESGPIEDYYQGDARP
jgi:flagellar biogenesis protein FliO